MNGQIVVSAIISGSAIQAVLGKSEAAGIITAILSTLLLVLNAYAKNLRFGEIAQKHRETASQLWYIRERYVSLLADMKFQEVRLSEITEVRDKLTSELYAIYKNAPSTNSKAYQKARKALQKNEELTFDEQEIDRLLPLALRRGE